MAYFVYNTVVDAANGVNDFEIDSTRISHPAVVIALSAIFIFIGFIADKKAATVTATVKADATDKIDLKGLVRRLDFIEDKVEKIEDETILTRKILTDILTDEGVLTQFNPNENDFNPTLTDEFQLIPLDEQTNRLELEPMIIVKKAQKSQKASKKSDS